MVSRRVLRGLLLSIILLSIFGLVNGYVSNTSASDSTGGPASAAPRDDITVIASHGSNSKLIAYEPGGSRLYVNDTYDRYFDVDPVPQYGENTVEYVAADHRYGSLCSEPCTRNVVERVNLTTGEVTRLYEQITPGIGETRWHDADRIDESHVVIAGIYSDRVFVVNTTTGIVEWQWDAQSAFPIRPTGNEFPDDWTHINDVEVLDDGRIMVSVRNHDRVVFLDRHGVIEDWTIGSEDSYQVINQQHNPDYIPEDHGGPAVVIADSHNNRIVEYQRVNEGWEQTWLWTDTRMSWPRDGDRLPNGHTLIADSNGNRVFEVNESGAIVWSLDIDTPYEAERLGTGDESAGGPSARSADLVSRRGSATSEGESGSSNVGGNPIWVEFWLTLRKLLPSLLVNAALYVLPPWVRFAELTAIAALGLGVAGWAGLEYRWSSVTIELRSPVRINR